MQYIEYLISTPLNYTCSNLADHLDHTSHDVVTDYLRRERLTAHHLWEVAQHLIDDSEESYLIIDDSVQNKQYSKVIELVKRQYSGATGCLVRGIGVVNLVHTNGKGDFCPTDFRIYAKTHDGKTKNDHFQEMLIEAKSNKQLKAKTILFDSWYASWRNLKLVHRLGLTFYTTLKSNRLISLDEGETWRHLQDINWTDEMVHDGIIVRLSKIPFAVKLFKLVATNGDIDWIVTNNLDSTITSHVAQEANDVRWEVEQFHRELKQLTGSEKCQCRKQRSQRNHLANCYHAWATLKVQARKNQQTVYQLKHNLLREYLRAELRQPRIPAFMPA
ncbi:MAG: transposase [Chloroflexota bacterium]